MDKVKVQEAANVHLEALDLVWTLASLKGPSIMLKVAGPNAVTMLSDNRS